MTLPQQLSRLGSSASSAASTSSSSTGPKKHRQTRIPEHLKAVKKGSSSSKSASNNLAKALRQAAAGSSSSVAASKSEKAASAAAAVVAQLPSPAAIATSKNKPTLQRLDDVANGQLAVSPLAASSPATINLNPGQAQSFLPKANGTPSRTTSLPSSTFSNGHMQTTPQAYAQQPVHANTFYGVPSPAAPVRYAYGGVDNQRANEPTVAAATSFEYPASSPMYATSMTHQGHSRPSTSTSTMALDSSLLARSCSSASSMAYSQPDFTFSIPTTSTSTNGLSYMMPSPMDQQHQQQQIYQQQQQQMFMPMQHPTWSNNAAAMHNGQSYLSSNSPPMSLSTGSSASLASSGAQYIHVQHQQQQPQQYYSPSGMQLQQNKVVTTPIRRSKRSHTSASTISSSSATSSSRAALASSPTAMTGQFQNTNNTSSSNASTRNTSPISPATPFSASLILSVSSDGRACLATPQMKAAAAEAAKAKATLLGSAKSTPKALAASGMTRSSTTNTMDLPSRPSMIRSNTTDPRMSRTSMQKKDISELNGVGRVIGGQGKMFDLKENEINSYSTNRHISALPKALNLDIEMDLAAATNGHSSMSSPYSNVAYPYSVNLPMMMNNGGNFIVPSVLTPPQSAEITKESLPRPMQTGGKALLPQYPEKERFQSSWKFPSGIGLNLDTATTGLVSNGLVASATSSPSSAMTSTFPSMHSLNASIVNVGKSGNGIPVGSSTASSPVNGKNLANPASMEMSRRQSRIQAWLDSPEMQDGDDTGASSWSSLPSRNDTDSSSAPTPTSSSSASIGTTGTTTFSISPASIMTRTASEMQLSSAKEMDEYEEIEVMRASGKSVHSLKISRKRRLDDGGNDSLSSKDRDALKAGLGMPFQDNTATSRQVTPTPDGASPGKRNKMADEAASKGRKGRRTKKKGSNICSCGTGDDGEAMIQCDDCSSWYHLECMGVNDEAIPETWQCPPCVAVMVDAQNADAQAAIAAAQAAYPSPSSPVHNQMTIVAAQTPKRPTMTREPTFSKTATPKVDSARHFDDAPLVAAPPTMRPVSMPSTPQNTPVNYTPSHSHSQGASLSRAYAPVTPRAGSSTQPAAPGTSYQWDTYSPHTPSNGIAHSRRLSRQHFRTPSSNWSNLPHSHWEDLPSSAGSQRRGEDVERTKQWEQFYNAPPPASINPIPMTPPLTTHTSFASSDTFLPSFEQEASISQRFLAIHATPSNWDDSSRFPSNVW